MLPNNKYLFSDILGSLHWLLRITHSLLCTMSKGDSYSFDISKQAIVYKIWEEYYFHLYKQGILITADILGDIICFYII